MSSKLNWKKCPKCGCWYADLHPAISREDNKTEICSRCGRWEALEAYARAQERSKNA